MPMSGQDFSIAIADASAATHTLNVEPRIPLSLERLNMRPASGLARPLLNVLSIAGHNLLIGSGFPCAAFDPDGITDQDNFLGVIGGPNCELRLEVSGSAAYILRGSIGTAPLSDEELAAVSPLLAAGKVVGKRNFLWGLGASPTMAPGDEFTFGAAAVNVDGTVRIDRAARLKRIFAFAFETVTGAQAPLGDVDCNHFDVAGTDLFARSSPQYDIGLLNSLCSDEDGLRINHDLDNTQPMRLRFVNNSAVSYVVQVGFIIE